MGAVVDTKPFRLARKSLAAVPRARWGAILASIASAIFLVALLPILYLGVDHLVWKGRLPLVNEMPAIGKQALAEFVSDEARNQGHGILSLLARQRSEYGAKAIAFLARTMPWTWQPDDKFSPNLAYLTTLAIAAVIVLLLHGLSMLVADYCAAEASLEVGTRLRRSLYAHATRVGLLTVKPATAREAADLFTTKVALIQDGIRAWLRPQITAPIAVILLLGILIFVNPALAFCFLTAGLLTWLVLGQYAARFAREGRFAARRAEARMAQMRESLGLLQLVKSYLMDRFSQTRLERQLTEYSRAEWRRLRGLALSRPALISAIALVAVGVLFLAGRSILHGHLSVAGLTLQLSALAFLVAAVRAWIAGRVRIRRAAEAAAGVAEFLDRRADAGQAIDAEFLQPMKKKLEVVELSVREPGSGRMILDNVSMAVPAGSRVAVVVSEAEEGRALMAVLGRFLEPSAGEIRIDNKNIRWVTLESLRTQVALVGQDQTVFTDTVSNNIGCGDPSFSAPQVINAAKLAHAHQFVQRLPYGYETIVGDGGFALRPGEKLRIALARALLRDPSLIIVEEPAEAMDLDSQTLLDDTFERARAGRTLIFLTHRETVLRHADHIFVLHHGHIVANGKHDILMENSELYRRLVFKELAASA